MRLFTLVLTSLFATISHLPAVAESSTGIASFYWQDQKTANGEQFDKNALTAAHRTLPFGTLVKVTRVATGQSVIVRINDRGPYIKGRVIDLSLAAAREIGLTRKIGITKVRVEVIKAEVKAR